MSTEDYFQALNREATARGMSDYERGVARADNPFKEDKATEQAARWYEGWDNARALDMT